MLAVAEVGEGISLWVDNLPGEEAAEEVKLVEAVVEVKAVARVLVVGEVARSELQRRLDRLEEEYTEYLSYLLYWNRGRAVLYYYYIILSMPSPCSILSAMVSHRSDP
jgi:hypothetical protein